MPYWLAWPVGFSAQLPKPAPRWFLSKSASNPANIGLHMKLHTNVTMILTNVWDLTFDPIMLDRKENEAKQNPSGKLDTIALQHLKSIDGFLPTKGDDARKD